MRNLLGMGLLLSTSLAAAAPGTAPVGTGSGSGSGSPASPLAHIAQIQSDGAPEVDVRAGTDLRTVGVGAQVALGETVISPPGTVATVLLPDESQIVVGPGSHLTIEAMSKPESGSNRVRLAMGLVRFLVTKITGKVRTFKVLTNNSCMGVRGTNFLVDLSDEAKETNLTTLEGSVAFAADEKTLEDSGGTAVDAGHESFIKSGMKAPSNPKPYDRKALTARLDKIAPGLSKKLLETEIKTDGKAVDQVDFGAKKPPVKK